MNEKKAAFAKLVAVDGMSHAAAARELGYAHDRQRGYELSRDPEVMKRIEDIKQIVGSSDEIDEEVIKKAFIQEAFDPDNTSRDRQSALTQLGRTKGMFKDVVENQNRSEEDFFKDVEKTLGKEVADQMREQLK